MNDDAFEALVMARPIVDNASERLYAIGELEYDGPRCAAADCDAAVEDDGDACEGCGPVAALPARLSPRAGSGCRRVLRRVRSYGWLAGLILAGLICVAVPLLTRGTYWTGTEWAPIPTGGIR